MTQKTLITILLDVTTSMRRHVDRTISGLNEYVDSVRDTPDARLTLVTFAAPNFSGAEMKAVFVAQPVATVRHLTPADMPCHGNTPLLEAIQKTILEIEASLGERRDIRPVLVIQTDGEENCSRFTGPDGRTRPMTHDDIRPLIAAKEAAGWEFVFMGCGIDAYADAGKIGLRDDKIVSYGGNDEMTESVFRSVGQMTAMYASGASATMAFSAAQKAAAGDVYAEQKE